MEEKNEKKVGVESTDKEKKSNKFLDWVKSVMPGSKKESKTNEQTLESKNDFPEVSERRDALKDFTLSSVEVRLQNLTKVFTNKKGGDTRAVDDFSVVIPGGKLVGLLGPSGCGKSTTLFLIAGLHKPTAGQIFFGEEDVTLMPPEKRGIGLVFQNYALYPHMTVRQNIMFPLENVKVPKEEAERRAQEMAELVHIGELMDRKPSQLSGGQQQRVAIARALVKRPRVLLLDEPLSNLDARLRLQMREEIKRIQRETGITTIFVTHDQEEAMSISDEIVILNYGQEMQKGAPQDIYNKPDNLFVAKFLGNPPINIFNGEIKSNELFVEGVKIVDKKAPDGNYFVGIRPEDFRFDPKGYLLKENETEVIGRDTMVRFMLGESSVRALVESEDLENAKEIRLTVREDKVHLFDPEVEISLELMAHATDEQLKLASEQIEKRNRIESEERNKEER